jgi:hypothetical protein
MDRDQLDQILMGDAVELASLITGINEGVQSHVGDQSGAASGHLAKELGHHPLWEVVRLEAGLQGHPPHLGRHRPVAGDDTPDQSIEGQQAEATLGPVANPGAVDEHQVARMSRVEVALAQTTQQQVGLEQPASGTLHHQGSAIRNVGDGFSGAQNRLAHWPRVNSSRRG